MVLEFAREQRDVTKAMREDTSNDLAIKVGRLEVIDKLMDLVMNSI